MKKAMNNFDFYNPTHIVFGKNRIEELPNLISKDEKILILYGGGSIKKNGIFDRVTKALDGYDFDEFSGIEPNPQFETLMKAVNKIKKEKFTFLLAVGGGSVIDGTKFIAAAVPFESDPINIFSGGIGKALEIKSAMPFGSVLTLPATGSEMNSGAVITFVEKKAKLSFMSNHTFPKFSILEPEATYSLPKKQLANGIVDSFIHVTEQYLTYDVDAKVQDYYAEGLLKTLIEIAPDVIDENKKDYSTRANFMWAATCALNNVISVGVPQDWATHMLGHEITLLHGIDHGRTLAIVLPSLLRIRKAQKKDKLLQYAERVWNITAGSDDEKIEEAISKTAAFFESLDIPTKFSAYNLGEEIVKPLVDSLKNHNLTNLSETGNITLDISEQIYRMAL